MKNKIFLYITLAVLFIFGGIANTSAANFQFKGIFALQNGWQGVHSGPTFTGGFPGKVSYGSGNASLTPANNTLAGSFWTGNAGWITFDWPVLSTELVNQATINCPTNILNQSTQICPVSGFAWSQNAGWIALAGSNFGGSGVYFNPNSGTIEGWGWSQSLGWVPFWLHLNDSVLPTGTSVNVETFGGLAVNFVSKIAILGNIAGNKVYSVQNNGITNQDVGYTYKSVNHASIYNLIKKNISLMSRNVSSTIQEDKNSSLDYLIVRNADYTISGGWTPGTINNKRAIIVIGGNIVINQVDVNSEQWSNAGIALITLKDPTTGVGGDIYISNSVKRIYAYMYAEGSLFSGVKGGRGFSKYLTNSAAGPYNPFNIPQNQLYIRGLVASKNTIGGAQMTPPVCPVLISGCTAENSQLYDWDYFRIYDQSDATQASLPPERSTVASIARAPVILEYDPGILINPPPGFREEK